MKKAMLLISVILFSFMILWGCSSNNNESSEDILDYGWKEIVDVSKEQKVNIHMWGGDESVNRYMDQWVAPRLKEQYDITLNRVPITDAKDMVNKLLTEKQVHKKNGTIDVFWINGENFKMCKDNGLLWGSFVDKLPNYNKYVDKNADDLNFDFGESTAGMEAPWGKAQFVFVYDSAKIKNPPTTMEELKQWIVHNPGKFTYPAPPDFTGSAFVRQSLITLSGGYDSIKEEIEKEDFLNKDNSLWKYLNDIKPYLWREGATYPESAAKLDQLYQNGEVWMTMSYNPVHGYNKVKSGQFPETSRTLVLEKGSLSNTHYLSIPYNASNKSGAMVVIDFLLSPQAQIAKLDPLNWGDGMVISYENLSEEEKKSIQSMDNGEASISAEELERNRIPEIKSKYVELIEESWNENVAKE